MRKVTKEGTKKEKKVRAGAEALAEPAGTPVAAEPTKAAVAESSIEAAPVVEAADVPAVAPPAEVPAPVEGAPAPASDTAPLAEAASIDAASAAEVPAEVPVATEQKDVPAVDLEALRKPVDAAKAALDAAEAEMKRLVEHAHAIVAVARDDYRKALAPYRDACRKAGRACEFEGGRGANVAARVGFLVERTAEGVCITIRGRPETVETIPLSALKESVGKAAYS